MIKKNYKPRVLFVLIFFSILFFVILIRLYFLQIRKQDFFQTLAKQQYGVELIANPRRGKIYDNSKSLLAFNRKVFSAFILPTQFEDKDKILSFLKKHYKSLYTKVIKNKNKKFFWLERRLSEKKVEWLKKFTLKDIHFIKESDRFYPCPTTSTVVGITDIDNIGIAGIELELNKRLKGIPSILELKKDARPDSFYFEKKVLKKGKKGFPVILTLDNKLQFLAYQELKKTVEEFNAACGSVLIMNPDNGHILSMANYPDFDPNQKDIKSLDETKNKIVTECYELGSVVKAFSALAALEEGVVTPDELIDCEGKVAYIDKVRIENWKAVDVVPFADVIRLSSNVGIAKVIKRIGPKFYTHLKQLGFGAKTGILFPGERSGFINPPSKWSRPSLFVMSFGYEIMATLLQLGKAFCIIANGGYDIQPILVKKPKRKQNTFRKKIYSDRSIKEVKDILQTIGVRYSKGLEDFRVMGKTGTARVVKNGKYSRKDHVYSFAGIIERENYRRVVITHIKEPKGAHWWASQITAPLFNRVAEKMIIHDLMKKDYIPTFTSSNLLPSSFPNTRE